jgi:hypothetical protein
MQYGFGASLCLSRIRGGMEGGVAKDEGEEEWRLLMEKQGLREKEVGDFCRARGEQVRE